MPQSKKQRVTRLAVEPPAPAAARHAPPSPTNCIGRIHPAQPEAKNPSSTAPATAKRPQLSATEKLVVLNWYHANGRNQKATAAHFQQLPRYGKLNQGTVSRWVAAEAKIRELAANGRTQSRALAGEGVYGNVATRAKSLKHPELEKCLTRWLEQLDASRHTRLSGREIKSTARQIYDELEVPVADRLELSNGWLGRFQARHGLKLHRRNSDVLARSDEVDLEGERKRIRHDVTTFLAGKDGDDLPPSRSIEDVWTMETTIICPECSPMKVENDAGKCRKHTKVTVGVAVNATGTERLEPIFVGHDNTHQQDFKYYFSNRTACLTSRIFYAWLRAWNHSLVGEKRHVLLLVSEANGNMTGQETLSNIQLRFFPPPYAVHLQPCRGGVLKAFHAQYRKLVIHRALNKLRCVKGQVVDANPLFEMSLLDTMELVKAAWLLAGSDPKLTASCWQKAQILPVPADLPITLIEAEAYISIAVNEEVVKLAQALQVISLEAQSRHVSLEFMSADEFVLLVLDEGKSNDVSIKELVQLVVGQDNDQENNPTKRPVFHTIDHSPVDGGQIDAQKKSLVDKTPRPSPPSNHTDVSPDVILHAQLTLEQYWAQNNFQLSPAIVQVLQQTRTRLQQQPASTPP